MANSRKHRGTRLFLPMEKKLPTFSVNSWAQLSQQFFSRFSSTPVRISRNLYRSLGPNFIHFDIFTHVWDVNPNILYIQDLQFRQNRIIQSSCQDYRAMIKCDKDFFRSKLLRNAYNMKIKKKKAHYKLQETKKKKKINSHYSNKMIGSFKYHINMVWKFIYLHIHIKKEKRN